MYLLLQAVAVILGITVGAGVSAYLFYSINSTAGYLMLPYLVWLCFANYLNISHAVINRDTEVGKKLKGI